MIIRDSTFYLLEQWITPEVIKQLKVEYNDLIKVASKDIDHIVESMNIPVHAIYSPIAKNYVLYNEKPYQGEVINAKMWENLIEDNQNLIFNIFFSNCCWRLSD